MMESQTHTQTQTQTHTRTHTHTGKYASKHSHSLAKGRAALLMLPGHTTTATVFPTKRHESQE